MNIAKLINLTEKGHYPFKAYPSVDCDQILFPGCSFPSMFPKTMDAIAQFAREQGLGVSYDCCGKSLAGYGAAKVGERVLEGLEHRLGARHVKRVVTLCPNCLDHLGPRLSIEIVSVFQWLAELGFEAQGSFDEGSLFIPCPDRVSRKTEQLIRDNWDLSQVKTLEKVGCCGLRPEIYSKGADFAAKSTKRALDAADGDTLYTYCSSCLGQFSRVSKSAGSTGDFRHVLSVLLGIDEQPDVEHAFMNRAKRKFDSGVNPISLQRA